MMEPKKKLGSVSGILLIGLLVCLGLLILMPGQVKAANVSDEAALDNAISLRDTSIKLENDFTISSTKTIDYDTIIWGNYNYKITRKAGFTGALFEVKGANSKLTLQGITLDGEPTESTTVRAALVNVESGGTLTLTGGTKLQNNKNEHTVNALGGAIYSNGGNVLLQSSLIQGNSAQKGGGIYCAPGTGKSTLTMKDENGKLPIVEGNTAVQGGGIYIADVEVNSSGSVIGQVVPIFEAGKITGNKAVGYEKANGQYEIAKGGGLYIGGGIGNTAQEAKFSGMTISGNIAGDAKDEDNRGNGGGIYFAAGFAGQGSVLTKVTITGNTLIEKNRALAADVENTGEGGGIYKNEFVELDLRHVTIDANEAGSGGGLYLNPNGKTTLTKGTYNEPETSPKITNNKALRSGYRQPAYGGGVKVDNGGENLTTDAMNVISATIANNKAEYGAGISCQGIIRLGIEGLVESNTADANGGGVYLGKNGNLTMYDGATIKNNTAEEGGGVWLANVTTLTTKKNTGATESPQIIGNEANYRAGGVFISGASGFESSRERAGEFKLEAGSVSNNRTDGAGGGVYVAATGRNNPETFDDSGIFNLEDDGVISGNIAGSGGGVYLDEAAIFEMKTGVISGNKTEHGGKLAGEGGGVYAAGAKNSGDKSGNTVGAQFILTGGEINGNEAESGGGIYAGSGNFSSYYAAGKTAGGSLVKLNGGKLTGNKATDGGAVYAAGGHCRDNPAEDAYDGPGTGLGGTVNIAGVTLTGNTATDKGGGIYTAGGAKELGSLSTAESSVVTFNSGTLTKNTAVNGGGIYIGAGSSADNCKGARFVLDGGIVGGMNGMNPDGNVAVNGGGIYLEGNADSDDKKGFFEVKSGKLQGNIARAVDTATMPRGAGLYIAEDGVFALDQNTEVIVDNRTEDAGGGIYVADKGKLTLSQGTITENEARQGGGVFASGQATVNIKSVTINNNNAGTADDDVFLEAGATDNSAVLSGKPKIGIVTSSNWSLYNLKVDAGGLDVNSDVGLDGDNTSITANQSAFVTNLLESEKGYFRQVFVEPTGTMTVMDNLSDDGEPLTGNRDHSLVLINGDLPTSVSTTDKVNWAAPQDMTFTLDKAFAESTISKAAFNNPSNLETAEIAAADYAYTAATGTLIVPRGKLATYQNNPLTTGTDRKINIVLGIPATSPKYYIKLDTAFDAENEVYRFEQTSYTFDEYQDSYTLKVIGLPDNFYSTGYNFTLTIAGTEVVPSAINASGTELTITFDKEYLSNLANMEVKDVLLTIKKNGDDNTIYASAATKLNVNWKHTLSTIIADNINADAVGSIATYEANKNRVQAVTVNGEPLDATSYITVWQKNSLHLTLKKEYLNTLIDGNYNVVVNFGDGTADYGVAAGTLVIDLDAEIPKITNQPQGGTYILDDPVNPLTVTASGESLTYQWYMDNNSIDGAVTDTYQPTSDTVGTSTYRVVVTNTSSGKRPTQSTSDPAVVIITEEPLPVITITPEDIELNLTQGENGELKGTATSDDGETPDITAVLADGSALPSGFALASENGNYTLTVDSDAAVGNYTIVITAAHPTQPQAQAKQDLKVNITKKPIVVFEQSEYTMTSYINALEMGVTGDATIIDSGSTFTLSLNDQALAATDYTAVVEGARLVLTLQKDLLDSLVNKDYIVKLTAENTGGETATAETTLKVNRRFDPVEPIIEVTDPTKPVVIIIDGQGHLNPEDAVISVDGTKLEPGRDYTVTEENGKIIITITEEFIDSLTNKIIDGYDVIITFEKNDEEYSKTEVELIVNIPPVTNFDIHQPLPEREDAVSSFNRSITDYLESWVNGDKLEQEQQADGSYILYLNGIPAGKVYAGSTIVRLYASYLETLPNGQYSLEVFFNEGGAQVSETIAFTINRTAPQPSPTIISGHSANTGDRSDLSLWITLAVLSLVGGGIVAVKRARKL